MDICIEDDLELFSLAPCDVMARNSMYDRFIAIMRASVVTLCLSVVFGGRYPPLLAQPSLSVEDAVQDTNIRALNEHLSDTDSRVQKQWDATNSLRNDMTAIQTEERVFGSLITLLAGSGLILQVRKKQA